MIKNKRTILAFCMLAMMVACQDNPAENEQPLGFEETEVCFKATLASAQWPQDAVVGIVATCTRGGVEATSMTTSKIVRYKAGGNFLIPVSEDDKVIAKKGDHAFHFVGIYPCPSTDAEVTAIPVAVPATQNGQSDMRLILTSIGVASPLTILPPVELQLETPFSIMNFNIPLKLLDGGSSTIKEMTVNAASGALTQTWTFNSMTGEFTEAGAGGSQVTVDFGEGLNIESDQVTVQFVTAPFIVPETGVQVSITKADNTVINVDALTGDKEKGMSIKAGDRYVTTLRDNGAAPISQILTVDDWTAFAESIEGGNTYEGLTVTLKADISVPGFFAYANGVFKGTFDGDGHKMTANGNKHPLFNTIAAEGVVENLSVYGQFTDLAYPGTAGNATIAMVNLGTIRNCTSKASIEKKVETAFVFGGICAQNGGVVRECTNKGDVTIEFAPSATKTPIYGGGISALGHTVTGTATETTLDNAGCVAGKFIDCTNEGNISVTVTSAIRPSKNAMGGICGLVYLDGVSFEGCVNSGSITRISDGEASNNGTSCLGGILGRAAAWYTEGSGDSSALDVGGINGYATTYTNCSNSGTLMCKTRHSASLKDAVQSGARLDDLGGIVGAAIGRGESVQKITGCTNTGIISGGWNLSVSNIILGGIVGLANGTEIKDCTVNATFKALGSDMPVGAAGGFVAYVLSDVSVSGSSSAKCTMDLYTRVTSNPVYNLLFYGLAFGNVLTSATVSATVSGSIKADNADVGISSSNFKDYVVSSISNVKPSVDNVTWAE